MLTYSPDLSSTEMLISELFALTISQPRESLERKTSMPSTLSIVSVGTTPLTYGTNLNSNPTLDTVVSTNLSFQTLTIDEFHHSNNVVKHE